MPLQAMHLPSLQGADVHLWLPNAPLMTCVRAIVSRNTLGHNLSHAQRYNYFPATPVCSLGWMVEGDVERLASGSAADPASPRVSLHTRMMFSGPHTQPTLTYNPGPAHGLMLMLWPDAMRALTGVDSSCYVNRTVAMHEVLSLEWQDWGMAVLNAPTDTQRIALIENFLTPRWQAVRPDKEWSGNRIQDWSRSLALRAATSGLGRSLRQAERRVKQWAGQPMRELQGMSRAERAFFQATAAQSDQLNANSAVSWTDVANDNGFSDQSHLCRVTRQVTGFSPDELRRRIDSDECLWVYRTWMNA